MKKLMLMGLLTALLHFGADAQVPLKFTAQSGHVYHVQFNSTLNRFWQDQLVIKNPGPGSLPLSLSMPANGTMGFYRTFDAPGPVFWYGWTWNLQSPTLQTWGMGTNQTGYVHNDRPYDWYVDQGTTGPDSGNNCGPASTAMVCKWYNQNSTVTAQGARNTYPEGNQGWYTTDVFNYLSLQGVPCNYALAPDIGTFTNLLAQGDILILCVSMTNIPVATNPTMRVQAFYANIAGHFIVAKGYRVTDSAVWIECYDPNDWGAVYSDGTPKGRDRHYNWTNLQVAMQYWSGWSIAIYPPASGALQSAASTGSAMTRGSPPVVRGQ